MVTMFFTTSGHEQDCSEMFPHPNRKIVLFDDAFAFVSTLEVEQSSHLHHHKTGRSQISPYSDPQIYRCQQFSPGKLYLNL